MNSDIIGFALAIELLRSRRVVDKNKSLSM